MTYQTLLILSSISTWICFIAIALNLLLAFHVGKSHPTYSILIIGLIAFYWLLDESGMISFAYFTPILSFLWVIFSFALAILLINKLKGYLRFSLLCIPILFLFGYIVNTFFTGQEIGLSLMSAWIS